MRQILVWRVARLFWLMTRVWGFWKWRRLFARLCFSERFSSSGSQSSPVRLVVRSSLLEEFVTFGRSQVICVLVFFLLETMDLWAERVASSCDKVRSVGAILVFRQSFIAHWTDRSCRVCVCVCVCWLDFFLVLLRWVVSDSCCCDSQMFRHEFDRLVFSFRFEMIEVMTQLPPPLISIDCDQLMYQDDPMLTCLNDATLSLASSSACWNTSSWDRFAPASSEEWLSDLYYNPGCPSFTSSPSG